MRKGTLFGLVCLLLAPTALAQGDRNPLEPADTSSPRATLTTFIQEMNQAYRLFREEDPAHKAHLRQAYRCLDLSEVPPAVLNDVSFESALRLKEVLDRIPLPQFARIPDAARAESEDLQSWTLPLTEVTLTRVAAGPRQGEFLFSAETVARSEEFYERARHLPYRHDKIGAGYEDFAFSPGSWIPDELIDGLPDWTKREFSGQRVWQWFGLVLALSLGVLLTFGASWGFQRLRARLAWASDSRLGAYVVTVMVLVVALLLQEIADDQIHITGSVLTAVTLFLRAVLFVAGVRLVALVLGQIAEAVIARSDLRPRGVDSQLIRLGFRVVIVIVAAGLAIEAAYRLGLPAYSVLTGLGIGGLAVALAARDTLANLFGSIMIMFDRPFRVGDWIKVGDVEGIVEDIGFRSTRIRTFYNSVVSVPSAEMMNAPIDNMGMRRYRRVRTVLQITYDTPSDKIEGFVEGVKNIILANPTTRKDYFQVVLHDFGAHSLGILVYFFVRTSDWSRELVERQRVLLEIIRLAEAMEVQFAFPTHTLHLESAPDPEAKPPAAGTDPAALRQTASEFGPQGKRARPRGAGIFKPPYERDD